MLMVGCGAKPAPPLQAEQNAPVLAARNELLGCEEAIAPRDIEFMLRSGSSSNEIIAELEKRGLSDRIDPRTRAKLVSEGAPVELLQKIETAHVLSDEERRRQASRQSFREAAAMRAAADRQFQQMSQEQCERERQQNLQARLIKQAEHKERLRRLPFSCPFAR
jgi:hypothetical protein